MRGVLWAREVRFFTVAAAALLVYALGRYTPAFGLLFWHLPGVDLFRRPADATFLYRRARRDPRRLRDPSLVERNAAGRDPVAPRG